MGSKREEMVLVDNHAFCWLERKKIFCKPGVTSESSVETAWAPRSTWLTPMALLAPCAGWEFSEILLGNKFRLAHNIERLIAFKEGDRSLTCLHCLLSA